MAKAEIVVIVTIDTELDSVDYDVRSAIDGEEKCWDKETETISAMNDKDAVIRYSQMLKGADGYYSQAVPKGFLHDLLARAIRPIIEDEQKRFGQ